MSIPVLLALMLLLLLGGGAAYATAGRAPARTRARRLTAVRERHGEQRVVAMEAQLRRVAAARATKMDLAFGRFLPRPAELAKRLARSGKTWTVSQYGMASGGLALIVLVGATTQGAPLLLALFAAVLAGLGLPHMVVAFLIGARVGKFNKKFPDAIELLVRGLRSGLPISETIQVVGQEFDGPIGEEFRSVSDKMKIGRSMDAALQETADRLVTPEFQFFVITIAIQRETGGNLAETLANLADVLRKRSQMKLKIKAMSSESKASAYIIGSLPFLVFGMIYNINAGYMGQFFTDQRLMVIGLGGLVWMGIGAGVMAKMIRFEI